MDKQGRVPLSRKKQVELLKSEARPFKFEFILKGHDDSVLTLRCDYCNLKFVMDTIEMRPDFLTWLPSRKSIEEGARKLYGEMNFRRR